MKKESINFFRIVDYLRLREFDVQYLLSYKLFSTLLYLTQDGRLRKSELTREVKNLLRESCPATAPEFEESLKGMVIIDFMVYDRKMSNKKYFSSLSIGCSCMDIAFDLNLQQSIKQAEKSRKINSEPIDTNISSTKQQLPVKTSLGFTR